MASLSVSQIIGSSEDIIEGSDYVRSSRKGHPIYERTGASPKKDFDAMQPSDVRPNDSGGETGNLLDGRSVNWRPKINTGPPALDLPASPSSGKTTKVRYPKQ
jgi:hypothetical protein